MHTTRYRSSLATTPWSARRIGAAASRLMFTWMERAAQRRALSRLDDRALKDIGLSRADVMGETTKRFWRG